MSLWAPNSLTSTQTQLMSQTLVNSLIQDPISQTLVNSLTPDLMSPTLLVNNLTQDLISPTLTTLNPQTPAPLSLNNLTQTHILHLNQTLTTPTLKILDLQVGRCGPTLFLMSLDQVYNSQMF